MRPRVVILATTVALFGLWDGVAHADLTEARADANANEDGHEAKASTKTVRDSQGGVGDGTSGGGGGLTCQTFEDTREALFPGRGATRGAMHLRGGDYYVLLCRDADGREVVNELRPRGERGSAGPVVDPLVLAEEAASRLVVDPPEVQLSPKTDVNQIVQLPTWMWVTNWESQSASASVPGVTSTVTARPTTVTWDMGNGDQVVCNGSGTPFDFSRPEEEQSTDCSYTYRHSSTSQPGGVYRLSATVTYDVSWSAEGAPGGGALPAVSETSSVPVRVTEIHAVEGVGTGAA